MEVGSCRTSRSFLGGIRGGGWSRRLRPWAPAVGLLMQGSASIELTWGLAPTSLCAFSLDKYHCPVLFTVFTNNTHIVAIRTSGNVYAYEVGSRGLCGIRLFRGVLWGTLGWAVGTAGLHGADILRTTGTVQERRGLAVASAPETQVVLLYPGILTGSSADLLARHWEGACALRASSSASRGELSPSSWRSPQEDWMRAVGWVYRRRAQTAEVWAPHFGKALAELFSCLSLAVGRVWVASAALTTRSDACLKRA